RPPPTAALVPYTPLFRSTAAARERRAVTFAYRVPEDDAPTTRRLQPWGVVCWRGRWYVVGHDLDRDAPRCFRLSRIVGAVRATGDRKSTRLNSSHVKISY